MTTPWPPSSVRCASTGNRLATTTRSWAITPALTRSRPLYSESNSDAWISGIKLAFATRALTTRCSRTQASLPPRCPAPGRHVFYCYAIRVPNGKRDALRAHLAERGIGTQIHYPVPIHLQEAAQFLGYRKGDLPMTEKLSDEVLSLPMYAELTDAMIERVASEVIAFMKK